MIELYGKKYAKTESELVGTLFNNDGQGTANGYYKVTGSGVFLSDMQGNRRAFIRSDGLGPVTVTKCNGKQHFMFSCSTSDAEWLGVPDSYIQEKNGAKELAISLSPNNVQKKV